MTDIDWTTGTWTNAPARMEVTDDGMHVTAVEESDAWRITSYGFVHDTEHALLAPFEQDTAMEVAFHLDFSAQFDQAGIFVKTDDTTWTKAGVERSDGADSLGAVVTRGESDWSLAPVPGWHGRARHHPRQPLRRRTDHPCPGRRRALAPGAGLAARPRRHGVRGADVLRAVAGRPHRALHRLADGPRRREPAPGRLMPTAHRRAGSAAGILTT